MIGLLLLLLAASVWAQPTITNAAAKKISWSAAVVGADMTPSPRANQRTRCGTSSGTYTHTWFQREFDIPYYEMSISGLEASTQYYCVIEANTGGANPYGASNEFTFTTTARPSSEPTRPADWNSTYPDTTSYVTVPSSCANLQADVNAAVPNLPTAGRVITVPAGSTCTISLTTPTDSNHAKAFTSANVNDATDTFNVTGTAFSENQEIMFGRGGCLPGAEPSTPDTVCQLRGPITAGYKYFARNVSGTSFQVSRTSGGSVIDIPAGLTGTGTNYVMPYTPAHSNELIIRPDCSDAQLPPPGVRIDPSLWPCLVTLQITGGTFSFGTVVFLPGMGAHHVRLTGVIITHSASSQNVADTADPRPTYGLVDFPWANALSYITLDRVAIHCKPYPDRCYRPVEEWDGHHMSIENSDMDNWLSWRPGRSSSFGCNPSCLTDGATITLTSGTYKLDESTECSITGGTFNRTNGTVGTSFIYATKSCVVTLLLPTGGTATCTVTSTLNGGSSIPCQVANSASPAWPRDAFNGYAAGTIAQVTGTGGVWTAAADQFGYAPSNWYTEGTNGLIAGNGPGPLKLKNNRVRGAGLAIHFDDSNSLCDMAGQPCPAGIIVARNLFQTPSWTRTNGTGSNGLRYMHRNGTEHKAWEQVLYSGNVYDGGHSDVSATGCHLPITPVAAKTSDYTIEYNTFGNGACGVMVIGGLPTYRDIGGPITTNGRGLASFLPRVAIRHNIFRGLNGWTNYEPQARSSATANPLHLGWALEDLQIENNLIYDPRGGISYWMHWLQNPVAGTVVRNNMIWFSNDYPVYGVALEVDSRNNPNCSSESTVVGKLNCRWQQALSANYVWQRNLIVPYFTNSSGSGSGAVDTGVTGTQYAGLDGTIQTGTTAADRLDAIKFFSPSLVNFRLRHDSPYISGGASRGSDGRDLGPDIDALEVAQGVVRGARALARTSTTAQIHWRAPDSFACSTDVSSDSFATWTRVSATVDGSDPRKQQANLTGLTAATRYQARVLCAVEQPVVSFSTLP